MTDDRSKPLLVFDGHCAFCRRWVQRWKNRTGDLVDYEPYQQAAGRFPEIPLWKFASEMQLIEPGGQIFSGPTAVFRALSLAGHWRGLFWADQHIPGFTALARFVYRPVAAHRNAADRIDKLLIGTCTEPPTHVLTRRLFLAALGVVYLIAFVTIWMQIDGLIGSNGILPIHSYLQQIAQNIGPERYRLLPTLCWLNSSDRFLHLLCCGGCVLSVLLIAGVFPVVVLILLWVCYLSLVVAGQDFLAFQWDCLLLETGFLAIFIAPWRWRSSVCDEYAPSVIARWLLKWLLFRVMFFSGVLKLTSGDVTWRTWTALKYHYETQPLPTWTAWYLQQLPSWFGKFSVGVMFFAELCLPPLLFFPRRVRLAAVCGIVGFQLLIAGSGNYGFFNLLTIVLCIVALDDPVWPKWLRRRLGPRAIQRCPRWRSWPIWITAPLALAIGAVTLMQSVEDVEPSVHWPARLNDARESIEPFRTINSYGLFRVMTTSRLEIVVEGSDDGKNWKEYQFKYKPGDLDRRPMFTTPLMPRLDWQMWFAALGDVQQNPWFVNFVVRLLQGSPQVLGLMGENPFPDHPPRYIRALSYEYHFTTMAQRKASGAWWRREPAGQFLPPVSLREAE